MARKKPLPYAVVTQAVNGDHEAIGKVLDHFKGYIIWLAKREYTDDSGIKHIFVDHSVCTELQSHLVEKILAFDLNRQI